MVLPLIFSRDLVRILGRLLSHLSLHEGDEGATLLRRHSDASDLAKNLSRRDGFRSPFRLEKKSWWIYLEKRLVRKIVKNKIVKLWLLRKWLDQLLVHENNRHWLRIDLKNLMIEMDERKLSIVIMEHHENIFITYWSHGFSSRFLGGGHRPCGIFHGIWMPKQWRLWIPIHKQPKVPSCRNNKWKFVASTASHQPIVHHVAEQQMWEELYWTFNPWHSLQDGPPKIAFSCLVSGFMVDITIANGGDFMVYKPTYIWGGPSPMFGCRNLAPSKHPDFPVHDEMLSEGFSQSHPPKCCDILSGF